MKAQALPQTIQRATNELEAAATEREKWNAMLTSNISRVVDSKLEEANVRLHKARIDLAEAINAECGRQFEAGIATGTGKAG